MMGAPMAARAPGEQRDSIGSAQHDRGSTQLIDERFVNEED
jgi:hypothetical protein